MVTKKIINKIKYTWVPRYYDKKLLNIPRQNTQFDNEIGT